MQYPSTLRLPAALLERLALDCPHPPYLQVADILAIIACPDDFVAADVEFCRQNAWSCLEFAAMREG